MHVSDMSTRTSRYSDITLPLSYFKQDVGDIRSNTGMNIFKRDHSNYIVYFIRKV